MLGKIEGRRRRGWQRMRWLDGITAETGSFGTNQRTAELQSFAGESAGKLTGQFLKQSLTGIIEKAKLGQIMIPSPSNT